MSFPAGGSSASGYGTEFWTVPGSFAEATSGRWVVFPWWSCGDVDSPYLYPINYQQFTGDYGFDGHGQLNLYRIATPAIDETMVDTTLRLDRHSVESAINSYGGGHEDRWRRGCRSSIPIGSPTRRAKRRCGAA